MHSCITRVVCHAQGQEPRGVPLGTQLPLHITAGPGHGRASNSSSSGEGQRGGGGKEEDAELEVERAAGQE